MRFATAACNFCASELQKVLRSWRVLYVLTSKCASRHSGVQFFDIRTSISAPSMGCFVHFHFKMRFSPQRSAIFQHQNFKKCSRTLVFCAFSYILTSKCAFRRSGVELLISLLSTYTSAPAALTGLLFDWPDTRIIEKTQHFATSLTFGADVYLLSSDFRASASSFCWLDYSTLLFNCPYCRKLDF